MIWRLSDLKEWFKEKIEDSHYAWAINHIDELPIEPNVINAGEWVKVDENPVVKKTGTYLFLCKGDNHLFYEVHELAKGMDLLWNFQGDMTHTDCWALVKPLYYYYIPGINLYHPWMAKSLK